LYFQIDLQSTANFQYMSTSLTPPQTLEQIHGMIGKELTQGVNNALKWSLPTVGRFGPTIDLSLAPLVTIQSNVESTMDTKDEYWVIIGNERIT
jgi:hypothetical protein